MTEGNKMHNTSPIIINEIRRLSQEEGLKDSEIAEAIQYSRVSVQRIRKDNNIPKYNMNNRKDKRAVCPQCCGEYFIRRKETAGIACPECAAKANQMIKERYYAE